MTLPVTPGVLAPRWRGGLQREWAWLASQARAHTTLLLLGLPALVALAVRLLAGPRPIDDAYITFRYARNLADGLGLVYNPGERVLGTTAPLWALLLAGGQRLGVHDLAWLATSLAALSDATSTVLLSAIARQLGLGRAAAALVGLAWALNPMSIAFASGGMETSLFILAVLAALALASRGRLPLAAAVAGLATLLRPEAGLLALVLIGWSALGPASSPYLRWRRTLRTAACCVLPMLLTGMALYVGYGSPLPNSVAAKQVAYAPAPPLENALALVLQAGLPGWSPFLLAAVPAGLALALAGLGLGTLVFLGRAALARARATDSAGVPTTASAEVRATAPAGVCATGSAGWQPFVGFAALYVLFYVVLGLRGVRLFPWYLVPLEPLYLLGLAAGLASLGGRRAMLLAALVVGWQALGMDPRALPMPAGDDLTREHALWQVGTQLRQELPPGAIVAAPEIGALGYASNLRMLDTVGLVSPVAERYYPLPPDQLLSDNAIPPRLIADQQPDAVVTLDAFAERSILRDPTFLREYALEASYPAAVWQSHNVLVFRRMATTSARSGLAP